MYEVVAKATTFFDLHIDKRRYVFYIYIEGYRFKEGFMKDNIVIERNFAQEAKMFKAFCDENRLRILDMLSTGERCACELLEELEVVQSTLSHHMKILVDSGIVKSRKDGKWSYYSLDENSGNRAKILLDLVVSEKSIITDNKNVLKGYRCD